MEQMLKEINLLLDEHYEEYKNFTRLLLTLSVAFITITTALKITATDPFSTYQKAGILIHCSSIFFGVWLQYILVQSPISDIHKYIKRVENRTEQEKREGGVVWRPSSFVQRVLFILQITSFVLAFILVVVNVLSQT